MNNTQLKSNIDSVISDQVNDNTITPTILGDELKKIVDYSGERKRIILSLDFDGSTVSSTEFVNDFSGETVTLTNPSNGIIRIAVSGNVLTTNKTFAITSGFPKSQAYIVSPIYDILPLYVDLKLTLHDGTSTGTPIFSNLYVELIVFD